MLEHSAVLATPLDCVIGVISAEHLIIIRRDLMRDSKLNIKFVFTLFIIQIRRTRHSKKLARQGGRIVDNILKDVHLGRHFILHPERKSINLIIFNNFFFLNVHEIAVVHSQFEFARHFLIRVVRLSPALSTQTGEAKVAFNLVPRAQILGQKKKH